MWPLKSSSPLPLCGRPANDNIISTINNNNTGRRSTFLPMKLVGCLADDLFVVVIIVVVCFLLLRAEYELFKVVKCMPARFW